MYVCLIVAHSLQVFIAFARVFSGTLRKGQKLLVLGPKYDAAKALEAVIVQLSSCLLRINGSNVVVHFLKFFCNSVAMGVFMCMQDDESPESRPHCTEFEVSDLYLLMGKELEALDSMPAGNIVGVGGLSGHVLKSATLASTPACPAFTDMHFEASPIVRVAVQPQNAGLVTLISFRCASVSRTFYPISEVIAGSSVYLCPLILRDRSN